MSGFSGGIFTISGTGLPYVYDTTISETVANTLNSDLATGLSTCILKDGTQTCTAGIPFYAGSVSLPGIYLGTDSSTGLYRIGANNVGFAVSGSKVLDISASGLGITGTTTSSGALTVTTGGATITAGGLTVTAGGLTVTAGAATITSGNFTVSSGVSAFTKATAGDVITFTNAAASNKTGYLFSDSGSVQFANGAGGSINEYIALDRANTKVVIGAASTAVLNISSTEVWTLKNLGRYSPSGSYTSYLYADNSGNIGLTNNAGGNDEFILTSSNVWYIGIGASARLAVDTTGTYPQADNTYSLGKLANRWTEVFATNGTINTSDQTKKTPLAALETAEIAVAEQLAADVGKFQWLDAVEKKGADGARLHIGLTVQRVMQVFKDHGLDPFRYGMVCYDKWDAERSTAPEHNRPTYDEDGNPVPPEPVMLPAGEVYSLRPDQVAMFMCAGLAKRVAALEAK